MLPSLSRVSKRLTRYLSHSLLPGSCSLCLSALQFSGGVLCHHCIAELPRLTNHCQRCSATLESNLICGSCQRRPPTFGRCISAFHYHSPIDSIILRLKNDPYTADIKPLSAVLAERIASPTATLNCPAPKQLFPYHCTGLK